MALTRKEFDKQLEPRAPVLVENVPGIGDAVYLRPLTGGDRDYWDLWQLSRSWDEADAEVKSGKARAGFLRTNRETRATLVALALCDEHGVRLYSDQEAPLLARLDGVALDFLYAKVRELNGIGKQAAEQAAKNSSAASDGSGVVSPENSE